jgi:hypothetical protein
MITVLVRVHDERGPIQLASLARLGTKTILVHLTAMNTKPLILFGLATVAALATTASGQNASPSGTLPPKRNQKPASVRISPKPTAIPSRAPAKNVVSPKKRARTSRLVMLKHSGVIATSVMITFGGSSTTLLSS